MGAQPATVIEIAAQLRTVERAFLAFIESSRAKRDASIRSIATSAIIAGCGCQDRLRAM
jgi:hypothetical protein